MKKWFTNWISGLRKGTDVPYPENMPHSKNIGEKSFRLKPLNKWRKNETVLHIISYFIFCPKHQKIAICDNPNIHREIAVYVPFIYLSPNIKHRLTELEGLSLILSDGDSKLMAKYKEERPFDTNISYLKRDYSRYSKIVFSNFWCFARLHSDNPILQCCRKTSRILWMSAEDFRNDDINCMWSPLSKTNKLDSFFNRIRIFTRVSESPFLSWTKNYHLKDEPHTQGQMVLKTLKITKKQIKLFICDYIEHCYPTPVMSFVSFKVYLRKYCEFSVEEKWLRRLFNGCASYHENFGYSIHFENLLICLAYLDYECPSVRCRVPFIFLYYDFDRDGYLSEEEFREMVRDIDTNQSHEEIERVVSDNMFINESEEGISFQEFQFRVDEKWLEGTEELCRYYSPILRKILSDLENKEKNGFKKRLNQYFRWLSND